MQNIEQGQFCFITDDYYINYDKERKLMRNKEVVDNKEHDRPCFYAFPDKKNPLILWCIPISSQVDKYMRIYDHKLEKQQVKGIRTPKCNTIRFGEVMGVKKAFLSEPSHKLKLMCFQHAVWRITSLGGWSSSLP